MRENIAFVLERDTQTDW